ncbi:hypothetical protein T05_12575 [Trichinella murrelli]|uniref:Uncharacterized protein n=1 Tax=Trichinella murrelli TaxID=144512 RepID=A0A0V0T7A5_9BILA|nr:hypothetical protein T05_12575 [Trichinella murrelli]
MLFDKRWRCVTKVQVQNATFRFNWRTRLHFQFALVYGIQLHSELTGQISPSVYISNLRKPAFTATCAVSVFYANWALMRGLNNANDVRRMNNGAFNTMTDEEDH